MAAPLVSPLASPRSDSVARAEAQRRRATFLRWLRKTHGWLGLWAAVFGFVFGVTGIVLAHRHVLKLPVSRGEQRVVQYRVEAMPATPAELGAQVAREFGFDGPPTRMTKEPARPVSWNSVGLTQPERWELQFSQPTRQAKVEYFVGNGFARVEKFDATFIGTLTRLHMAVGVDIFWVLLLDTMSASLIVLALTGTLLWTQMRPGRLVTGTLLLGAPAATVLWLAFQV
jgi:hypothetical protein